MFYETDSLPTGSVDLECLYQGTMLRTQLLVTLYKSAVSENPELHSNPNFTAADISQINLDRKTTRLVSQFDNACSEDELMDVTSHYCARLAACARKDTRHLLLVAETLLFSVRYGNMDTDALSQFLLQYKSMELFKKLPINTKELNALSKAIYNKDSNYSVKIPWTCVLDLVRSRTVSLDNGDAHVPCTYILQAALDQFCSELRKGLNSAKLAYSKVMEDERLAELLPRATQWLQTGCNIQQNEYGSKSLYKLDVEDVDKVSVMFPLCMRQLHHVLRQRHRLGHTARIQYTLFLKSVGMEMKDAIEFWKSEYSKPHSECQANCSHNWSSDGQRYMYSIRHLYGREGRMVDYQPHSCQTLQKQVLSTKQEGGCPFKHLDEESLQATLESDRLSSSDVEQVMQLVGKGRYSEACWVHHTARVGMVVQSCDDEKPTDCKQTPVPESNASGQDVSNDSGRDVFTNPAQYFTSFVDEIQSDSE